MLGWQDCPHQPAGAVAFTVNAGTLALVVGQALRTPAVGPATQKAVGGRDVLQTCALARMWRVAIWRRTHPLSQISEFGARCLGMEGGRGPGSSLAEAIARMMATVSEAGGGFLWYLRR